MRILLTGSGGSLGAALKSTLQAHGVDVHAFDRQDIMQPIDKIAMLMRNYDWVYHVAANTNVERCEQFVFECYEDNYAFTAKLAKAAKKAGIKLLYVSSTGVYGSAIYDRPYTEEDPVCPTTHHHRAKWLGEKAVEAVLDNFIIVRLGWLFGGDKEAPKNFVYQRLVEQVKDPRKPVKSDSEQMGSPTYIGDVSDAIVHLSSNNIFGIFNVTSGARVSRYAYVQKIFELSRRDVEMVPVKNEAFCRQAKVALNESASCEKLAATGFSISESWDARLAGYLTHKLKTD